MAEFLSIDLSRTEARLLAYLVTNAQAQVEDPVLREVLGDIRHLLSKALHHHRDV